MLKLWRRILIGSPVAVYIAGLGCAGGLLAEGVRAHARSGALGGVTEVTGQWLWLSGVVDLTPVAAKGARW
jgi:hypothetical protein